LAFILSDGVTQLAGALSRKQPMQEPECSLDRFRMDAAASQSIIAYIADQQQARRAWILRHRTVARIIASSETIGLKK
jgi:hypothetical protein